MNVNDYIVAYKKEKNLELRRTYQKNIYMKFEMLFEMFARKYSFLAEYDDIKQECYFALLKALEKYDLESDASFMTYLYKVVSSHVLNYCRSNGSLFDLENLISLSNTMNDSHDTQMIDMIPSDYDLEEDIMDKCFQDEVKKLLNNLLLELDWQSSEIVRLHYIKGLTLEEVADRLGLEYSHIKSICYCSINKLKRMARKKKDVMDGYFADAMSQAYKSSYGIFCRTGESSTEKAVLTILSANDYLYQNKYL